MLKGSQKKMIVVRTRDSRLFEEAYFVMRRDRVNPADSGRDMLAEADRIISSSLTPVTETAAAEGTNRRWRRSLWFFLGSLCGSGLTILLWWLL